MAPKNPEDRPHRRAVRLSELLGQESVPLSVHSTMASKNFGEIPDDESEEIPVEPEETSKARRESDISAKLAGSGERKRRSAYDAAMNLLAFGDNSEKMLREKLIRRGYDLSQIGPALTELRENRILCDARLMERYAAALSAKKYYGAYRIRMEMLRRFDRESVDAFFEDSVRELDFAGQARIFAEKNAHKGREYLIARLRALGYSREQIKMAVSGIGYKEEEREE